MNDPEGTEGRALSTEQIAAAGAEREDPLHAPAEQSVPARQAAPGSDPGAADQPRAQRLAQMFASERAQLESR